MSKAKEFDAIVVGSGPNGLSAAIVLKQAGLSVLLVEGSDKIGGGMRTAELTLPGFKHDVCSAVHPMAAASPFFKSLPLKNFGLEYIQPPVAVAHPFDNGSAAVLMHSIEETSGLLGIDGPAYSKLIGPIVKNWPLIEKDVLAPLHFPSNPGAFCNFGLKAIAPATKIAERFTTDEAKALWAGLAAHSILPLTKLSTSAVGLVLAAAAHSVNWPIPRGGSQAIANALESYFRSIGGKIVTNFFVKSLKELPSSHAVLLNVDPKQLLQIGGDSFSPVYQWQLNRFKYGMGVFKIDWALDGPVPFVAELCRKAGTVHLGNSLAEIKAGEQATWKGLHPENPFVLLAQPGVFDDSRAPQGKHTVWAYCHVPNGSGKDMTETIERQVERFAPGFRERIIGRHTMNTNQMHAYNANYYGGDIIGGAPTLTQLFSRPALRFSPYRTSARGIYICSASTPPGGGVHGMCGYHAAQRALKDIFPEQWNPQKK